VVWNSRRDSRQRLCFIHVTVENSLGFTLQDCNRVMEHTRFLLLTRSTAVEGYWSRIERKRERSQSVPVTLPASYSLFMSYFKIINVHQNRCVWTVSTLSLCSFPTHVLPVLSVRKRSCIFRVPPKFHNLSSRGNITAKYKHLWRATQLVVSSASA